MKSKFFVTALRGFVVLIPIIVLTVLLGEMYNWLSVHVSRMMENLGMESNLKFSLVMVATITLIFLIAYFLGSITEGSLFRKFSQRIDEQLQNMSQAYRLLRLKIDNNSAIAQHDRKPVFVKLGNVERPGFLVHRFPELSKVTVFVPKINNEFDGDIYVVHSDDVRETQVSKSDFVKGINHMGEGLDVA